MIINPKVLIIPALFASLSSAVASPWIDRPVSAEGVEACVAEINRQADYSDATRVVHNIDVSKRHPVGHELKIQTLVLDADGAATLRSYATECTVTPKHVPLHVQVKPAS